MSIIREALAKIRPPADAPAADWAARIRECWSASVEAVLQVGQLLMDAKDALPHGAFGAMVASDLPFTRRTAEMLMAIARDPRLTNAKHVSHLPPSWGTLYQLTKLSNDAFDAKIADGTIRPDMERQAVTGEAKKAARTTREAHLAAKQAALPDKRYGVIYADPEWRFEPYSRDTGMDRAADNHYPTSGTDAICSRPVASIAADDCVLFLWATVPMLPDALRVMAAWGFVYKSHCVWVKDRVGTGYWFRNAHELLLVGTKGSIPAPAPGTQWPSTIEAAVTRHSAKPERFYELIEEYFPNLPKIELNARQARKGWDAWGYEAPTDAAGNELNHDADGIIEQPRETATPENTNTVTHETKHNHNCLDDELAIPDFLNRNLSVSPRDSNRVGGEGGG